MKWTQLHDIRLQVERLWTQGVFLESLITGVPLFPRRFQLRKPSSNEMVEHYNETRAWIAELTSAPHVRVVLSNTRHRTLGTNQLPTEVWIDSLDQALSLIKKTDDAHRFVTIVDETMTREPALLSWLAKNTLRSLEVAAVWKHMLDLVAWMRVHPQPNLYLRQVDVAGISTKFFEKYQEILRELFDLVLPPGHIDQTEFSSRGSRQSQLCRRYGFREKPLQIRFRILDPRLSLLMTDDDEDLTISHRTFVRFAGEGSSVFITENEINFLAFPPRPNSIVIFGSGYGFSRLKEVEWLHRASVYYWGDIDTHGFAILDQLRATLPHVRSLLMDRATFMTHESQWVVEPQPVQRNLLRLEREESDLYDDLRDNRLGASLRLEQERIGFAWVLQVLAESKIGST